MKFSSANTLVLLSAASAATNGNGSYALALESAAPVYTTVEVVDTLTVPCSGPTTLVTNGNTYTATEATTLTITDCPCTLTHSSPAPSVEAVASTPSASASEFYTTEHVTVVETLHIPCTGPTTVVTNGATYTATEATTLTITDCPCTHTVKSTLPVSSSTPSVEAVASTPSAAPSVAPSASPVESEGTVHITEHVTVVQTLTTHITAPTTLVAHGNTYTVTEDTTLSITDCPCTETVKKTLTSSATPAASASASSSVPPVAGPVSGASNQTTPAIANSAAKLSIGFGGVALAALLI